MLTLAGIVGRKSSGRDSWQHRQKWQEIEEIIASQMYVYMQEGKGAKAGRLLAKIRLRNRRG